MFVRERFRAFQSLQNWIPVLSASFGRVSSTERERNRTFTENNSKVKQRISLIFPLAAALIVSILYAEILVSLQTTASRPKLPSPSSILFAFFCFVLPTLTIASKCCASKTTVQHRNEPSATPEDLRFRRNVVDGTFWSNFIAYYYPRVNKRSIGDVNGRKKAIRYGDVIDRNDDDLIAPDNDVVAITNCNSNCSNESITIASKIYDNYKFNRTDNNVSETVDSNSKSDVNGNLNGSWISGIRGVIRTEGRNKWNSNENEQLREIGDQPMPPAHDDNNTSLDHQSTVLVLVVSSVALTVALTLVTCVLSHYRGGTAADPHDAGRTPTTAPMLSVVSAGAATGVGGMADRLRGHHHGHHHHHHHHHHIHHGGVGAATVGIGTTTNATIMASSTSAQDLIAATSRDRQVRLQAVHTDFAINMPPSIALPDGENHPYSNTRLHIRDSDQESEIYQKCIKPPPNRTVLESESPPPYRSSSAGLLGSSSSSSTSSSGCDWSGGNAPLVVRCHSMSSSTSTKRPSDLAATSSVNAAAALGGQKTDFLQRTVKIFTGGGKKNQPQPAPTLLPPPPVVIVPTRSRDHHNTNQQPNSATGAGVVRPKPPCI